MFQTVEKADKPAIELNNLYISLCHLWLLYGPTHETKDKK